MPTPAQPDVSVIIPTSNRWNFLSTCALPSALGQLEVEHEVIVVDDHSTDGTRERLAELDRSCLRVLRHGRVLGVSKARNTGIEAARGKWLAFLDDDDLWSPRKLRIQLDLAGTSGASFVYARAIAVDEHRRVISTLPLPDPDTLVSRLRRGSAIPAGPSNVLVQAELVRRVGGFDPKLDHSADWDMWIRLARHGRAVACDEILVARVEHRQRMLFRDRPDVRAEVDTLLRSHYSEGAQDPAGLDEWLAVEHLVAGYKIRAAGLFLRAAVRRRRLGNIPPALGALLGKPGMRLATRLLIRVRGRSHLSGYEPESISTEPDWLARYR